MKLLVLAVLALMLAGCAGSGGVSPRTAAESKPRQPAMIEDASRAGGY